MGRLEEDPEKEVGIQSSDMEGEMDFCAKETPIRQHRGSIPKFKPVKSSLARRKST